MFKKGRQGLAILTALILLLMTLTFSVEAAEIDVTNVEDNNVIANEEKTENTSKDNEAKAQSSVTYATSREAASVINHYMLSEDSSNVFLYVTTGNNEPLSELKPGVAFTTTNAATYFYVKIKEGYGTGSEFQHLYESNAPNRTEFPNDWSQVKTSTYVSIDTAGYSPNRYDEAYDDNCTYMFQYTGKSGTYGNFWTQFKIKADPVIVRVKYLAADQDGGDSKATGIPTDSKKYYHTNVTEEAKSNIVTLSSVEPEREGYTFSGWQGPDGTIYNPGDTINIVSIWNYLDIDETAGSLELKAVWTKDIKKVNISYNGNGNTAGAAVKDTNTYDEGTEVTVLPNTWRKTNCSFYAWNTSADGTGKTYKPGETILLEDSTTLYAQWIERGTLPIRYEMIGGLTGYTWLTSNIESVLPEGDNSSVAGSTAMLKANENGEYEYEFIGWSTSPDEALIFQTDAKLIPVKADNEEWTERTYYAIFKKKATSEDNNGDGGDNGDQDTPGDNGGNGDQDDSGDKDDNGDNDGSDNSGNQGDSSNLGNSGASNNGNGTTGTAAQTINRASTATANAARRAVVAGATASANVTDGAVLASNSVDDSQITQLEDEEVPLANTNLSNWALINLIAALLTVILSIILLVGIFGRKDEKDSQEMRIRRHIPARIASLIPAVAAIIIFLVTENMKNPMVLTDKWTLLMVAIFAVQLLVAVVAKKKHDDQDMDTATA